MTRCCFYFNRLKENISEFKRVELKLLISAIRNEKIVLFSTFFNNGFLNGKHEKPNELLFD